MILLKKGARKNAKFNTQAVGTPQLMYTTELRAYFYLRDSTAGATYEMSIDIADLETMVADAKKAVAYSLNQGAARERMARRERL